MIITLKDILIPKKCNICNSNIEYQKFSIRCANNYLHFDVKKTNREYVLLSLKYKDNFYSVLYSNKKMLINRTNNFYDSFEKIYDGTPIEIKYYFPYGLDIFIENLIGN